MRIVISKENMQVFIMQVAVFSTYAFNLSIDYYMIAKVCLLLFMVVAIVDGILTKGKGILCVLLPVLFTLYMVLSSVWSCEKDATIAGIVTQLQYLLLVFACYFVVSKYNCINKYFSAIFYAGLCLGVLALLEYGGAVNFFHSMIAGYRLGGELGNENIFGMTFAICIIIAFYFYVNTKKWWYLLSIVYFALFLLSSQSKKAIFLAVAGVILFSSLYWGIRQIWKTLIIILVCIVGLIYLLQLEAFSGMYERLLQFFNKESTSDLLRMTLIEQGLINFKKNPILGYGYGSFANVVGVNGFTAHSNFVSLLVELGLVGFVLYYAMYVLSFLKLLSRNELDNDSGIKLMITLLLLDVVLGYGMVQVGEKSTWISLAMYLTCGSINRNKIGKDICSSSVIR